MRLHQIRIDLELSSDGKIEEIYFDGDGCCISQASASMLVEKMDGKTVTDIKDFTAQQMLELFGARLTPNRQKCCLLSWRVLQSAIFSPLDGAEGDAGPDDDSTSSRPHQQGPNLGEES